MLQDNRDSIREVNCLFQQPWWLDAVCPGQWDAITVKRNNRIVGRLPYVQKKCMGMRFLVMPPLTQTLGPWIGKCLSNKYHKKLAWEKSIMNEMVEKSPSFDYFHQNFHSSIENWLPFYWNGFSQTTRYSYVIENLNDLDAIFSSWSNYKKTNLKKAHKLVSAKYDLDPRDFYKLHSDCLSKEGKKISYSYDLFNRVYTAAYARDAGKIIYAVDKLDNIHSALFVVWDNNRAYNLMNALDPAYKTSASTTLLIKNLLVFLSKKTKIFDFDGSMNVNIEKSLRQLGTRQSRYFTIHYASSRLKFLRFFYYLAQGKIK